MIEIVRQALTVIGGTAALATIPSALELLLVTSGAMLVRRRPASLQSPGDFSLAVVVPAHNEELLIGRCVASLLAAAQNTPGTSVVVVADNCSDETATRAREAGARVFVREDADCRGKGFALRFAFDRLMAEGFDGFLIVDADSMVSANLIDEIVQRLRAGDAAVQTRYRVAPPLDSERKRLMDIALLAFNVLRPRGRAGWGLSAGILGNGFALSRQTLLDIPYTADSIVEDLEYHLLLVGAGKSVSFADAANVYGDMPNDENAQASQRARWEGGRLRVASAWIPKLSALLARGKTSVAEPLLELLTLPLAYLVLAALGLCVLPVSLFQAYGVFLLGLVLAHLVVAVTLGGNAKQNLVALASAPAYVFWKLTKITKIIRSARPETQWLRTPRASDGKRQAPRV